MEIFINEWSFREQFHERDSFAKAITAFLVLIERVRTAIQRGRGRLWISQGLTQHPPVRGQHFLSSLNEIGDHELREAFGDVVFNRANPAPWQPERIHQSTDRYLWLQELVSDTSIAELAERRLRDAKLCGCLINLSGSFLVGSLELPVSKGGATPIVLMSFDSVKLFESWLVGLGEVLPYSAESTDPPRDEQTCLVDSQRYESTGKFVQGRRIYQHRLSKNLLYVDNMHFGAAAHIEIFDKFKRHLGEGSLLDGNLRPGTRDAKKTLE